MENEKMLISTKLIGLRGGLSLISRYTDEIKKYEAEIRKEELITSQKEEILHKKTIKRVDANNTFNTIKETYDEIEDEIEEDKKLGEKELIEKYKFKRMPNLNGEYEKMRNYRFYKPNYFSDELVKPAWILSFFAGLIAALLLIAIVQDNSVFLFIFFNGLWAIPTFNFIVARPMVLLFARVNCNKEREEYNKKIGKLNKDVYIEERNKKLTEYHDSLKKAEYELKIAREEEIFAKKDYEEQKEKTYLNKKKYDEAIFLLSRKSRAVSESLNVSYGQTLVECDWKNIDLIIHYIETGRADSLKEALLLVDQQRQTDQIVFAINSASRSISNHIESAFSRMGQALAISFEKLNDSINGVSRQLESNKQSINEANQNLAARLDAQISTMDIQNALLEKANKSSDELLNDLRYNQRFWIK